MNKWATALIGCSMIMVIIESILPSANFGKSVKFIARLMFIMCIAYPLYNIADVEISPLSMENITGDASQAGKMLLIEQTKKNISQIIEREMAKEGIIPLDIRIDISVTNEDVIFNSIEVDINEVDAVKLSHAQNKLTETLQLPISLTVVKEQKNE